MKRRHTARVLLVLIAAALVSACTSASGGGRRSTSDARVRSFKGQVPPDLSQGGRLLRGHPSYAAGSTGGPQLVARYVQFAFPT